MIQHNRFDLQMTHFSSASELSKLQEHELHLHRYVHHFKNGDRHQISFRQIQDFRKELRRYNEACSHVLEQQTKLEKVKGSAVLLEPKKQEVSEIVENWMSPTGEGKLEKWYLAFTQLTQRSEAPKGLFLLTTLASVAKILGISGQGGLLELAADQRTAAEYGELLGI